MNMDMDNENRLYMHSTEHCRRSYLRHFAEMEGRSQVWRPCPHLCPGLAASLWVANSLLWVWQPEFVEGAILLLA